MQRGDIVSDHVADCAALVHHVGFVEQTRGDQTAVTVVIQRQHQSLCVAEGLALIGDILNALPLGLGDVDLVIDAGKFVIVVHADIGVEADGHVAGLILVEKAAGLPFHNRLELLAGDLDSEKCVVILIDLHAVPVQEGSCLQIGGGIKQGGQRHVRAGLLHLDLVDQVDDGIVLNDGVGDAGQELHGIQEGFADLSDLSGGHSQALFMQGLEFRKEVGIGRHGGAVQQLAGGGALIHRPAAAAPGQGDSHLTDVLTVGSRLQHGDTADGLVHYGVSVTDQQRVDTVTIGLRQSPNTLRTVFSLKTIVDAADDHIGLAVQLLQDLAGLLHGGGKGHVVIVGWIRLFPLGDMRGVDAEHRNFHAVHIENMIGVYPTAAIRLVDVAGQGDAFKFADLLGDIAEAKVELVVAQGPGVIVQVVQRANDGVWIFIEEFLDVVGLSGVAGIQQKQIGVLAPFRLDDGCRMRQTGLAHFVGSIVIGVDHAVQVTGLQDGDGLALLHCSGSRQDKTDGHCNSQDQRNDVLVGVFSHLFSSYYFFAESG